MSTCIYYDLPIVTAVDVSRARAAAGSNYTEAAPSSARWDADAVTLPERLNGAMVQDNQDRAMAWVETLGKGLERAGLERWSRRGASLFEVSRYEFLFEVLHWEHRWWVAHELHRRLAPNRLLWIARPDRRRDHHDLIGLADALTAAGLRTEYFGDSPSRPAHREFVDGIKERVWTARSRTPRLRRRQPGRRATASRIVFTDYFHNNIKSLTPVSDRLESDHGERVQWLAGRKEVRDALSRCHIDSHSVDEFVSFRGLANSHLSSREVESIQPVLASLSDVAPPWLAAIAQRAMVRSASSAAFWIEAYHEACEALRPELLVSSVYSGTPGRAAATQVRAHGGKSVYVQHGLYADRFVYSFYLNDLKLMWGEYEKRSLVRFGHSADTIRVTGAPLYDSFERPPPPVFDPAVQLRIAYLPTRSAGITLPTAELMARAVATTARTLGADLIVKPHPGDQTGVLESVLREFPEFRLARNQDAGQVIRGSDLVVVVISTVGNEVCLADRPLISFYIDAAGWGDYSEYVRYGAALPVSRPEDLLGAVTQIRDNPEMRLNLAAGRRALIDDMLNGGHNDAAQRVAAEIAGAL